MEPIHVLVLADPGQPHLRCLEKTPPGVRFTVGLAPEVVEPAAGSADAAVLWFGSAPVLERIWPLARRLRWVHSCAVGLDGWLFPALAESPVVVTNGRGAFSGSLGEFALAAVLFFAKDLRRMVRSQEQGVWDPFDVDEIAGQTLGIVGYGDIGRSVARRARAFGLRVLALRRHPERSGADPSVDEVLPPDRLLDLVARSDYLVVAAPLTSETRSLIGTAELAALRPSAVVINVGRGAVIDEAALAVALRDRRIRGAALDVFAQEPLPPGHPFYRLDNVLLSPHCADHTRTWLDAAMRVFLDNVERFRAGEPLANVVDKRLGY
jgi:phosphoglycerate dehydrogenase-like enzyme